MTVELRNSRHRDFAHGRAFVPKGGTQRGQEIVIAIVRQRDHSFAPHLALNVADIAQQALHRVRRTPFPQRHHGSEPGFRGGMPEAFDERLDGGRVAE